MESVIITLWTIIILLCFLMERNSRELVVLRRTLDEKDTCIAHLRKAHKMACRDICALEDKLEKLS